MKPKISIVVAMAKNRAIGKNGQLLWHISNDLKHFKKVTTGKCVIMGHNTYVSLPGQKALPNRRNVIISDRLDAAPDGFELATSIQKALLVVKNNVVIILNEADSNIQMNQRHHGENESGLLYYEERKVIELLLIVG